MEDDSASSTTDGVEDSDGVEDELSDDEDTTAANVTASVVVSANKEPSSHAAPIAEPSVVQPHSHHATPRRRKSEWDALTVQWFRPGGNEFVANEVAYSNKRARRVVTYSEGKKRTAAHSRKASRRGCPTPPTMGHDMVKLESGGICHPAEGLCRIPQKPECGPPRIDDDARALELALGRDLGGVFEGGWLQY